MLKKFIQLNKNLSNRLARRSPHYFSGDVSTIEFEKILKNEIESRNHPKVLEVGGADRPFLAKNKKYQLHGLDIDPNGNNSEQYDCYELQSIEYSLNETYDVIYSITLLEHVKNNKKAISVMSSALNADGVQVHYVPNKYHPYAILLRIIGNKSQRYLIKLLKPEAILVSGYKAYFDKCSPQQMADELIKNGQKILLIKAFYRANDYFNFFLPLYVLISGFENICRKYDWILFSSGYIIVACKK